MIFIIFQIYKLEVSQVFLLKTQNSSFAGIINYIKGFDFDSSRFGNQLFFQNPTVIIHLITIKWAF